MPPDVADAPRSEGEPDTGSATCEIAGGCCGAQATCIEAEVCVDGDCVPQGCSDEEGSESCPATVCTTPDCEAAPAGSGPRCDDGQKNGTEADVDCGLDCPERCPPGSSCARDDECTTLACTQGRCTATCDDQTLDQDETDVDCGGICGSSCLAGQACREDGDCSAELRCSVEAKTCVAISCEDGVRNGTEIFVDCGGSCPGCAPGAPCDSDADCASRSCAGDGLCAAASCIDGLRNQDEAGVDCGGSCPPCASIGCRFDRDCDGTTCGRDNCAAGLDQCCQPASCSDGITNAGETSTDCGGPDRACPRCPDGAACDRATDCSSNDCLAGVCVSCGDGVADGLETDVDCGGPATACRRCPAGLRCAIDSDCVSGVCEAGQCCGGTLGDCTRCAERLSQTQDCSDAGPGGQGNCTAFLQCLANNRSTCPTRYAPGCSSDPGVCNHNFFGGDGSVGVQQANAVIFDAGCQF